MEKQASGPEGASIPVFEYKGAPLNKENALTLTSLIVASLEDGKEEPMEKDDILMNMFLAKVAEARIRVYPLPFNISNMFFAASVLTFVRSPGMVMGMLWLAKCYAEKKGKKLLKVEDWCNMFMSGPPTEAECEKWWDAQKVTWERKSMQSDNMVDYPELWGCAKKSADEATI